MDFWGLGKSISPEVEREAQFNFKQGKQLLQSGKINEAIPYLTKAIQLDPENLDTCNSLAMKHTPASDALAFFKQAEASTREHLKKIVAPDCFVDRASYGAPNFWGILDTRPYMRLLLSITRLHVQMGNWNLAVKQNLEILRLCRSDNMGQRDWTGPLLLHVNRPSDALYFCQEWLSEKWDTGDEKIPIGIDFKTPSSNPLTQSEYDKLSRYPDLQMIHSAALASFMLYGDTELSRQYLHIAVKQYPFVMIKVLGRFKERTDIDNHPVRSHNGIEDARDHLYLAQDLWSKDDVWNWVNNDPVVKTAVLRPCSDPACRKVEEHVGQWQKCSGCKEEWYCSRACQKSHWPNHKETCKERERSIQSKSIY